MLNYYIFFYKMIVKINLNKIQTQMSHNFIIEK